MMMTEPVVTAAGSNPLLTTFAADVMEAQLTDTLNDAPALTVFAPTNAAFESAMAADPSGMDAMMGDPTGAFAQLLTYHVVEGQLSPDQLVGEHTTLQGRDAHGGGQRRPLHGERDADGGVRRPPHGQRDGVRHRRGAAPAGMNPDVRSGAGASLAPAPDRGEAFVRLYE